MSANASKGMIRRLCTSTPVLCTRCPGTVAGNTVLTEEWGEGKAHAEKNSTRTHRPQRDMYTCSWHWRHRYLLRLVAGHLSGIYEIISRFSSRRRKDKARCRW